MKTLRVIASLDHLDAVVQFTEHQAEELGLDPGKASRISLVLEEAFVNICSYAYPGNTGHADIRCGRDNNFFMLEIGDEGAPFNVLSLPEPDTTLGIEEREIGGLGVHFIRKLPDRVDYRRENNCNLLRMFFAL
ncbi:ATP-binding protein [Desulfobotulus sp. H1]|uniref:ATP-binding protein n=1 Tax=Desulfobotulus pelophilus TaxID=2823377 RepID=A0ABT3N9W5_9BACT|nr:ATP-binding protein [Desulfobotulus pelophilus]MCW7754255.1 ATP-binding protein [Desulfobotulus pelophilus]